MAKADDTTSKIDWIWLREALELAVATLGSVELAEERLMEWLAAGELPWSCMAWKGLSAEEIAREEGEAAAAGLLQKDGAGRNGAVCHYTVPSAAYCQGDPSVLERRGRIDWEENARTNLELAAHGP